MKASKHCNVPGLLDPPILHIFVSPSVLYEADLHRPGIPCSLASGWICPWGNPAVDHKGERVRSGFFPCTWLAAPAKLPSHRAAPSGPEHGASSLPFKPKSVAFTFLSNPDEWHQHFGCGSSFVSSQHQYTSLLFGERGYKGKSHIFSLLNT